MNQYHSGHIRLNGIAYINLPYRNTFLPVYILIYTDVGSIR